ncbi:alpha-hydroxy-acid oxidizing protein [Streptomyces sp. NBC_00882]|uniref:alpha-hydroxy acid oxidase n=1 Tax=Streptomyces sp. NBC_00882 TaxID=2975856 RepID=UPI003867635D|nr:alpha-hydroxy-acid oxidizing protein [Streptomyces sp. NBC_00882]
MEETAFRHLSLDVWGFINGGSGDEGVLRENRVALDRVRLTPRVLRGAEEPSLERHLLGRLARMPLAVAPMAYQRLIDEGGELAAARAARAAGVPFIASTLSSFSIEEIAAQGAATWFQLYWLRNRSLVDELVERAEACGCQALVLTVDVPRMGRRLRDVRAGFRLPETVRAANLPVDETRTASLRQYSTSAIMKHTAEALEPALSWADVERLRRRTRLPLVLKGIMDPADAVRAVGVGVDAVIVSNHGGRQFDAAPSSIRALADVLAAVPSSCEVFFDSGVRSGTDVLKAMALGARGALVGRPVLWGLAAAGERGVADVLSLLRHELEDALALAGCAAVDEACGLTVSWRPDVPPEHGGERR